MAIASGSRHGLAIVGEASFGVTPATPTLNPIRHTGTTIGLSKDSLQSEELRSDRQIADFRGGNRQIGGDINFELSYGSFDNLLEAVFLGDWAADTPIADTDQLKVGTTTRSFTMQRDFSNLTDRYIRHVGCVMNTFSMTVAPNAIVTCSIGVIGQDILTDSNPIAGATLADATTSTPFDSFTGSIDEGGSTIGVVTEITFSLENGVEPLFVVGSPLTLEPTDGRSNLTGTLTAYFENHTLLDKFIDETTSSITLILIDADGNQYKIIVPEVKYTGGQPDVSGEGPVTLPLDFQAILDPTELTNLILERTPV